MAEEDSVLNELEDQCTCWVCFEVFKDPITLLCLHSFCKECTIKVYKRDAQCPFCRRPFALPLPPINKNLEAIVHGFLHRPKPPPAGEAPQTVPDVNMNTEMLQQSVFLDLPNDVIVDIMSMLGPDDVGRSARVCTRVNKCTQNGWIWRTFAQQTSPFCNVEKYNRNWKNCYVGLRKRQVGWTGGKAGDFEVITMRGHTNFINHFILSNNRIITAAADSTLKIWPTHKNEAIATLEGHHQAVRFVQSDGIKVLSGADDDARLWDFATGINTGRFTHGGCVLAVLLDDNQICTGGTNTRLKVWDIRSQETIHDLGGHMSTIQHIKKDDAGRIVSCSNDAIKVWDLRAAPIDNRIYLGPAPVVNLNVFNAPGANCIQISKNKIVAGGLDGRVHVHDSALNTHHVFAQRHNSLVHSIQCDGSKIVTGSADSTIKVWDIARNELLRTLEDHKGPVHDVQFDNSKIVSCSADNTVKVWKMETGQRLYTLLGGSLQARANNPPHPQRPGCSGVLYDESSIFASFNALLRNYCFEPTPPQAQP